MRKILLFRFILIPLLFSCKSEDWGSEPNAPRESISANIYFQATINNHFPGFDFSDSLIKNYRNSYDTIYYVYSSFDLDMNVDSIIINRTKLEPTNDAHKFALRNNYLPFLSSVDTINMYTKERNYQDTISTPFIPIKMLTPSFMDTIDIRKGLDIKWIPTDCEDDKVELFIIFYDETIDAPNDVIGPFPTSSDDGFFHWTPDAALVSGFTTGKVLKAQIFINRYKTLKQDTGDISVYYQISNRTSVDILVKFN